MAANDTYYQDLRISLRNEISNTDRIARLRLLSNHLLFELPFPRGVLPESLIGKYTEADDDASRMAIANSTCNGHAMDSLIIFMKFFMPLGMFEQQPGVPTAFYDLLFHSFGRKAVNDYVVKGRLLELFRSAEPEQTGRESFRDLSWLMSHRFMQHAFWLHPAMLFWKPHTMIRDAEWNWVPYTIPASFYRLRSLFPIPTSEPDIGRHLSSMYKAEKHVNTEILLVANNPQFIAVLVMGGRKFNDIRSFVLTAKGYVTARQTAHEVHISLREKKVRYHLRAVMNLSLGDIRLYTDTTVPVVHPLQTPHQEDDYRLKLDRPQFTKGWEIEKSPNHEFLLFYQRQEEPRGLAAIPPDTRYGESLDPRHFMKD
jgi:hypothetical protein